MQSLAAYGRHIMYLANRRPTQKKSRMTERRRLIYELFLNSLHNHVLPTTAFRSGEVDRKSFNARRIKSGMVSIIRRFGICLFGNLLALVGGLAIAAAPGLADTAKPADPAATRPALPATAQTPQGVLPNGATALAETYNDWQVICAVSGTDRHCVTKQEQINQQNHQLVLAVELIPDANRVEGVALFPFGIALESGVVLQIDEQPPAAPLHFKTCVSGGCLVALSFDTRTVAALRIGTSLKAKLMIDGGSDATLTISLKGLSAAIDRTNTLLADRLTLGKN